MKSLMLRNKKDRLSIGVILLHTAMVCFLWQRPEVSGHSLLLLLVSILPIAALIHLHQHVGFWRSDVLNRVTGTVLGFFYSLTSFSWVVIHNENHHVFHNEKKKDVTSTFGVKDQTGPLAMLGYLVVNMKGFYAIHFREGKKLYHEDRKEFYYYMAQLALTYLGYGILFSLSFKKYLLLIVLPQAFALITITIVNYLQHVQTNSQNVYECARNFTGKIFNTYLFNTGYHTVHHLYPKLHWSKVGEFHQKIVHQIPSHLNSEPNIVLFGLKCLAGQSEEYAPQC